jgi:hypothetical protein
LSVDSISLPALGSFMPVDLRVDDGELSIDLLEFGREAFREPFYKQTIERHAARRTPPRVVRLPLGALRRHFAEEPRPAPAGFVFHLSRCGSTLVANVLAASARHRVIKEPHPLNELLIREPTALPPDARRGCMRALMSAWSWPSDAAHEKLFVKTSSWNVLDLGLFQELYPDTPWIFLYRDPVEVMVSNMRDPHQQWAWNERVVGLSRAEMVALPWVELMARTLARKCEAALAGLNGRGMLLDYADLSDDAVWARVLRHFGVDPATPDAAALRDARARDAKDLSGRRFEPDSKDKQSRAPDCVRHASERWLAPVYERLVSAASAASS